jgi:DNA-binding beta-propeller fold protein YncE
MLESVMCGRYAGRAATLALVQFVCVAAACHAGNLIVVGSDGKELHADGRYSVLSDPAPDTVTVLDARTYPPRVAAVIEGAPHSNSGPPQSIAITPDEKLILVSVPNHVDPADGTKLVEDDYVSVIDMDGTPPKVINRVTVGKRPLGIAVSPRGDIALVANYTDGTVSVLSIRGKEVTLVRNVPVGEPNGRSGVTGVAIHPSGKWALATKRWDHSVALLSIDGEDVQYITLRDPTNPGVPGDKRYPGSGDISVGSNPRAVAISPDGRFAAVGNIGRNSGDQDSVTIIDMAANPMRAIDVIGTGQRPEAVAFSPDSKWLAVATMNGAQKSSKSPFANAHGKVTLFAARGKSFVKVGEADAGKNLQGVVFTPDSKYLMSEDYEEAQLSIYRVERNALKDTGKRIRIPHAFPASISIAPIPLPR